MDVRDPSAVIPIAEAAGADRPVAGAVVSDGPEIGRKQLV
jgi:hypothetical protein